VIQGKAVSFTIRATVLLFLLTEAALPSEKIAIGVYYYPGWKDSSFAWFKRPWEPIKAFPEKTPLLGYYPEGEVWVAEKHIDWASVYGIDFFAYDWYWDGNTVLGEHALDAYRKAKNKNKIKFCILWANHSETPKNLKDYDDMVNYWLSNYFNDICYYKIYGKPVVFIFSWWNLLDKVKKFGLTAQAALVRADSLAKVSKQSGIYFIDATNEEPSDALEKKLAGQGYNAYTGWNYVFARNKQGVLDYDSMVATYIDYYRAAEKTSHLIPYIVSVSPGWDSRPWKGPDAGRRLNSSPEKFATMLAGAKKCINAMKNSPQMLMIEAWNEYGEGAYIEPTKQWGFQYLEALKNSIVATEK
jgi:hypothetical protein